MVMNRKTRKDNTNKMRRRDNKISNTFLTWSVVVMENALVAKMVDGLADLMVVVMEKLLVGSMAVVKAVEMVIR